MSEEEQIKTLQRQLAEERSLREEAETQLQIWRQKAIDTKLNAVRTRTELTEEVEIAAANSRTPVQPQGNDDVAQLKRENASLKQQRDQLTADLEALAKTGVSDATTGDESLQKERRSRRASEAVASTLREQLAESERQRSAAETEAQRLRIDLDRMKNLLTAAEHIIVQGRGGNSGKTTPTKKKESTSATTQPEEAASPDQAAPSDEVVSRGLESPEGSSPDDQKKAGRSRAASIASIVALTVGAVGTVGAVAMHQTK